MKLCQQRISANLSLLVNKVCQIYALRARVSDNFVNTSSKISTLFPFSFTTALFCSRVTYVFGLKFGTLKPHPERNIEHTLFCSEMSAHSLTKYYIAGFCSVIVKMSVLLKNTLKVFLGLFPNL